MDTHNLDVFRAKEKTQNAENWRGTVEIPMGGETIELGHRLLNEGEMTRLQTMIDSSEAVEYEQEQAEEYERAMELQEKPREELSESERKELEQLLAEIRQEKDDVEDQFSAEALDELLALGKEAVKPSPDDVRTVWEHDAGTQKEILGDIPSNREDVEDVLTADAQEAVTNSVYPVKLRVAMKALRETKSVWGNGLQSE